MGKNHKGQGKGKPKLGDRDLGQALIKRHLAGAQGMNGRATNTANKKSMASILDTTALNDYVDYIEMEGREVEVRRVHNHDAFLVEPSTHATAQKMTTEKFDYEHLPIPRKPAWSRTMTAEEVDRREKDAFINWRREIANMEDGNTSRKATPFEKNLEVWRQLWRVLERSDMAVQIVDARNPLLYYTSDLMKYASELSPPRPMMLLINKADFLTEHQRRAWAAHFDSMGIKFAFYSAFNEQEKIDEAVAQGIAAAAAAASSSSSSSSARSKREERTGGDDEDDEDEEDDEDKPLPTRRVDFVDEEEVELLVDDLAERWISDATRASGSGKAPTASSSSTPLQTSSSSSSSSSKASGDGDVGKGEAGLALSEKLRRRARVLTRNELILLLSLLPQQLSLQAQERHEGRICIGMLGYPNVGKSSVINTILGVSKSSHGMVRVGVSSTPGKTKHFQTLVVSSSLMLCDCPGLVFPSFMRSTGEMLCAGILPINQMRDYNDPANVISSRVPMHLLEAAYGIHIKRELDVMDNVDRPPTGSEVLCAYCAVKGYITNGTGRWDEFRACKELLRDFNDGLILFASPPNDSVDMERWQMDTENIMMRREKVAERLAVLRVREAEREAAEEMAKTASRASRSGGGIVGGGGAGGCEEEVEDGHGMVFGDFSYRKAAAARAAAAAALALGGGRSEEGTGDQQQQQQQQQQQHAFVFDDDDESEMASVFTDATKLAEGLVEGAKREHKRLKHWGKKNRRLRDKNPYSEENGVVSFVAYSTNRSQVKAGPVKRQDPRATYGTSFVRATLPNLIAPTRNVVKVVRNTSSTASAGGGGREGGEEDEDEEDEEEEEEEEA